jgi:hypothetical protein
LIYGKNIGRIILDDLAHTKLASPADQRDEALYISDGLEKIASFSLNETTEMSVKEIMKIASGCIKGLVSKIDGMNKTATVTSLAKSMLDKGMIDNASLQDKVAELMKKDDREISIIKEAISLVDDKSFSLFEKQASVSGSTNQKRGMFASVMGD